MQILNYLGTIFVLIAIAGMLYASYIAAVIVWERKLETICIDEEPCNHKQGNYCALEFKTTDYFEVEVLRKELDDYLVKFHCSAREATNAEDTTGLL